MMDAAALLEQLRRRYPADDLRPQRGFGADALTTNGKIFAGVTKGKLMVKLPAQRADELIASGIAEPFVMRGRAMREWVLVPTEQATHWPELVEEAFRFVGSA